MLKEIIEKGYYSLGRHFDDWQEAVYAGYRTLLEAGVVKDIYVQTVIDYVSECGPYIVIVPGIAMPYSTEGAKGCHGTAISFVEVEKPVDFDRQDSDEKVRLSFPLAAVDHEQHLHGIQELMDALMDGELISIPLEAHTVEELQQVAQTYEA